MRTEKLLHEARFDRGEGRRRSKPMTIYLAVKHQSGSWIDENSKTLERNTTDARMLIELIIDRSWKKIEQARRLVQRKNVVNLAIRWVDVCSMQQTLEPDVSDILKAGDPEPFTTSHDEEASKLSEAGVQKKQLDGFSIEKSKSLTQFRKKVCHQPYPVQHPPLPLQILKDVVTQHCTRQLVQLTTEPKQDDKLISQYRRLRERRDKQAQSKHEKAQRIEQTRTKFVMKAGSFAYGYNGKQIKLKLGKKHIKLSEEEELMRSKVQSKCTKMRQGKREHIEAFMFKRRNYASDQNIGSFLQSQPLKKDKFDDAVAMALRSRISSQMPTHLEYQKTLLQSGRNYRITPLTDLK